MDDQIADRFSQLLRWCAILRLYEEATLAALAGADPQDMQALLEQGLLLRAEGEPGHYLLHADVRRRILAQLRQERPRNEIDLHAGALHYFARRMQRTNEDEANLLYHLGALHDLFIEYMEWETIISYTSTVRNSGLVTARLERWLEFYEAYTTMRTGGAAEGRTRLEALLTQPNLEPALRLRALHTCHIAYVELSRYDQALHLLEVALVIARKIDDAPRESYILLSIGQIYNDLDDHQRALEYSERGLRLAQASDAIYREAHALYEVGSNAMQLGDWERALVALNEAAAAYQRLGMTRRLAMIL
jgi:tetratricopeptide (TPR) repeat protein